MTFPRFLCMLAHAIVGDSQLRTGVGCIQLRRPGQFLSRPRLCHLPVTSRVLESVNHADRHSVPGVFSKVYVF